MSHPSAVDVPHPAPPEKGQSRVIFGESPSDSPTRSSQLLLDGHKGLRRSPVSGPTGDHWLAARLAQARYRLHRDSLYVFLRRDDVEPPNNSSERDLRPSVIHRKVIGSFRSAWGAEASAIRTSILATARKQGRNLFDAFLAIAGPSPLQAITPTA
jgi:hypothetical protein